MKDQPLRITNNVSQVTAEAELSHTLTLEAFLRSEAIALIGGKGSLVNKNGVFFELYQNKFKLAQKLR